MNDINIISRMQYPKHGYEIRHVYFHDEAMLLYATQKVYADLAYTLDGFLIGDKEMARRLCRDLGIRPERRTSETEVCSIGYSTKFDKWFGWSLKGLRGFGVGDTMFSKENEETAPITNMGEARLSACKYAEHVGGIPIPTPEGESNANPGTSN